MSRGGDYLFVAWFIFCATMALLTIGIMGWAVIQLVLWVIAH